MTETSKKYFHELTDDELYNIKFISVVDFLASYSQPDWCEYPDAIHPTLGCWSLTGGGARKYISKEWCSKGCDLCKKD